MFFLDREEVFDVQGKEKKGVMPRDLDVPVWTALRSRLQRLGHVTVAFSGGIDSRFLAHAALHADVTMELVHVCGPHVAPSETDFALDWAKAQGLAVRLLRLDPLSLPQVASGERERCYACKSFLFQQIMTIAHGRVCDGSNASDAAEFRPGRRALLELGILSPLAEAGLTKDAVRSLAAQTGLSRPNQQSRACLLTRLPYGRPPDHDLLVRLAEGERAVEDALRVAGYAEHPFRLRGCEAGGYELHLGSGIPSTVVLRTLEQALHAAGFPCIPVRRMTTVSGYFDNTDALQDS